MQPELIQKLNAPFPDSDIQQDKAMSDGFRPRYIAWDKIQKRLDEVFEGSWSFVVVDYREFGQQQFVVHGRLQVKLADGTLLTKDGIGSAPVTLQNGTPVDLGYDLKAAASDALKRCALLFGVGIQLYEKGAQRSAMIEQGNAAASVQQNTPAQPFQVANLRKMLANYTVDEKTICEWMKISSLEQVTSYTAAEMLAGTHYVIQHMNQQGLLRQGAPAPAASGGLKGSNA